MSYHGSPWNRPWDRITHGATDMDRALAGGKLMNSQPTEEHAMHFEASNPCNPWGRVSGGMTDFDRNQAAVSIHTGPPVGNRPPQVREYKDRLAAVCNENARLTEELHDRLASLLNPSTLNGPSGVVPPKDRPALAPLADELDTFACVVEVSNLRLRELLNSLEV